MSQPSVAPRSAPGAQPLRTTGTVLATYSSYEPAQQLVDRLADAEFHVQHLSIIGKDLVNVEQVVERLSYPRVALSAAMTGMTMGLMIGLGFALLLPDHNWASIIPMVIMGGCIWVIMNVIGYSLQKGRRDFVSQSQIIARSYDVICEPEFAAEARRLLGGAAPAQNDPAQNGPSQNDDAPAV